MLIIKKGVLNHDKRNVSSFYKSNIHYSYILWGIALVVIGLLSCFFLDDLIASVILHWKKQFVNKTFSLIIYFSSFLIAPTVHATYLPIILFLIYKKYEKLSRSIYVFGFVQLSVCFIIPIFKICIGRERPSNFLTTGIHQFHPFSLNTQAHSLPSGHASIAFTISTFCAFLFPRYRIIFFGIAALLSSFRLWEEQHYLGDLLIGAGLGVLITYFISYLFYRRLYVKTNRKTLFS